MSIRTVALAVVSAVAFSGVVYATFSILPGLGLPQFRELSLLEADKAGRTWDTGHLQLHLSESGRYFLSGEGGDLETGFWRFESPERLTMQPDEGAMRTGTVGASVLKLDAVGWLFEVSQLEPICDY